MCYRPNGRKATGQKATELVFRWTILLRKMLRVRVCMCVCVCLCSVFCIIFFYFNGYLIGEIKFVYNVIQPQPNIVIS